MPLTPKQWEQAMAGQDDMNKQLQYNQHNKFPNTPNTHITVPAPFFNDQLSGMQANKNQAAVKDDKGKPRFDLIPPEALFSVAEVFEIGSRKYDARNWEKGLSWGRVFAAMMRHAWKFWRGERYDEEDGQEHMASVIWCAMVLLTYQHRKI